MKNLRVLLAIPIVILSLVPITFVVCLQGLSYLATRLGDGLLRAAGWVSGERL